jgi:hypothetical protein
VEKNETTEMPETQTLLRNVGYQLINFKMIKERMTERNDVGKDKTTFLHGNNDQLVNTFFNILGFFEHVVRDQTENIGELRQYQQSTISIKNII